MAILRIAPPVVENRRAASDDEWLVGSVLHCGVDTTVRDARRGEAAQGPAKYVVKQLHPAATDGRRERFRREAELARSIAGRHVVPALSLQLSGESPHYVMPKLTGATVAHRLARRSGDIDLASALGWARQIAAGLATLHAAGFVHGDVRPEHVMVSPEGHVSLIGLELTRSPDADADYSALCVLGRIEYLSPDAIRSRHRVDHRSDLYSLGVVLYEVLTGRRPHVGATVEEVVSAHVSAEPKPLREARSSLPNELCELALQLLHKQPQRRPQAAAEVVDRLARLEIAYLHERI